VRISFITALVYLCLLGPAQAGGSSYETVDARSEKMDLSSLGLETCHPALWLQNDLFTISCHEPAKNTKKDSGIRLYLVEKLSDGKLKILFRSRGSQDSYILRPTILRSPDKKLPTIILAETGAEYSWGIEVFIVKGKQITHAGSMEVGADAKENPESAVPYTWIKPKGKKLVFVFTTDLVYMRGGKFTRLKKNQIRYEYDGTQLKEIKGKQK
jgi:hypothetical protein